MNQWHNIANKLPDTKMPVIIFDGYSLYEIAYFLKECAGMSYWWTKTGEPRIIDMPYWCYIPEFTDSRSEQILKCKGGIE